MTSLLSLALVAAFATTPQSLTTTLFDQAAKIKAPPAEGKLSAEEQKANTQAFSGLDALIDLHAFSTAIMKPHEKKFSKKDLKQLKADFAETVRLIGFPRAGELRDKAKLEVTGTSKVKNQTLVTVFADIPSEELEVELIFHWTGGKNPKVVDVSIDGSSLVMDYRNQFGRIIAKDGAKALLEKLQKKLATLRQKYGA
jgi:ABC-type transporter MlaC component